MGVSESPDLLNMNYEDIIDIDDRLGVVFLFLLVFILRILLEIDYR